MFRMNLYRIVKVTSDGTVELATNKLYTMLDYARPVVKELRKSSPDTRFRIQKSDTGNPWEDVRYE